MDGIGGTEDIMEEPGTGAGARGAVMETPRGGRADTASIIASLPQADREDVERRAAGIDPIDRDTLNSYGADAQSHMADFSRDMLRRTQSRSMGEAGELLRGMLTSINDNKKSNAVAGIPVIGRIIMGAERMRRNYQNVSEQLDEVAGRLERVKAQLVHDVSMYDDMAEANAEQYHEIRLTVLAGRKALEDFRNGRYARLKHEATESGDPMKAQLLQDAEAKLDRFEKRLDDLERIGYVTVQTQPQLRILRGSNEQVIDKIQTTITTTLPLWNQSMLIALGLRNQRAALDMQRAVDDATNKLLIDNANELKLNSIDAAKASQRSVIDLETLEKTTAATIDALKETIRIQREGRENRANARERMAELERSLHTALVEAARATVPPAAGTRPGLAAAPANAARADLTAKRRNLMDDASDGTKNDEPTVVTLYL